VFAAGAAKRPGPANQNGPMGTSEFTVRRGRVELYVTDTEGTDVIHLLESVVGEPVALVGQSMGGHTAPLVASAWPDLIDPTRAQPRCCASAIVG